MSSSQLDPALLHWWTELLARIPALTGLNQAGRPEAGRWQDDIIAGLVEPRTRVLDLGCGNGELLARLRDERQVVGQGIELDPDAVSQCVERGVPVIQADLDSGLKGLPDKSFDVVICEETLQTVHSPKTVLTEMLRIGRRGIVTFPNFAHWQMRLDLAIRGRMPESPAFPHPWSESPNIHPLTLLDFQEWAHREHVSIAGGHVRVAGEVRSLQPDDNLNAEQVLLVIERC